MNRVLQFYLIGHGSVSSDLELAVSVSRMVRKQPDVEEFSNFLNFYIIFSSEKQAE